MTQLSFDVANMGRLQHLAQLNGVSTSFWDWHGNLLDVSAETLITTLQVLGVGISDAPDATELDRCIAGFEDDKWLTVLPPTTVLRGGNYGELLVHVPDGESVSVSVAFEDGSVRELRQVDNWDPPREVNGAMRGRASFAL